MAEVNSKHPLDHIDKVMVITYRIGMVFTGIALFSLAVQQYYYPLWLRPVLILVALGALLQASALHIYSKRIRYLLVNATWIGCWLMSVSFMFTSMWVAYLGLGAFVVTFSGLAYKESFCFSQDLLKMTPILLVASWLLVIFSINGWAAIILACSSLLYLYMAWKKMSMPLRFDLGDRNKYEV